MVTDEDISLAEALIKLLKAKNKTLARQKVVREVILPT